MASELELGERPGGDPATVGRNLTWAAAPGAVGHPGPDTTDRLPDVTGLG